MGLPLIIVHGGAGAWKDDRIPIGLENVEKAAIAGFQVLEEGGSALDAAEVCTLFMESCGNLNAGAGARSNLDGVKELDAMIIDGSSLTFGSVAAVTGILNPVSLARYILEKTDYAFFAGDNARRVYEQMIAEGYREETGDGIIRSPIDFETGDTVGCVTVDSEGRIAATSSTGGISNKMPGRVGDSPVMGAGAFANEVAGATATGWGEHIMRVLLTRMVVLHVEQGSSPMTASEEGMKFFQEKTGSEAGVVAADKNGNYGWSTNAKAMPTVVISGDRTNIEKHLR
ncbi:MAG: isoaspartyl peptidase/L-asparaginase [Candidatus Thorarchaeota archaeon]|nr:MAG: isoaspartyl peptidase/L-asparaginase [Candidatus Thorarchaeota archaeon]